MRRVIVWNLASLDGFMAGPNGEIDWFTDIADKEFNAYSVDNIKRGRVDTLLFGRVTYQLMESYWPAASPDQEDPAIIEAMNNYRKVVFSKTLKSVDWKNSLLVKGNAADEVAKLKQQPGRDMMIFGSGGLVTALAPKGLIDDYRIFIVPVVLGSGKPLFENIRERLHLKLLEAKTFNTGLVALWYQPQGEG
jgi:dihydrofolate reductase